MAFDFESFSNDVTASAAGTANASMGGLDVGENCAAGNMNGGLRKVMAYLRQMWDELDISSLMPLAGGTFTGDILRNGRGAYLHHNSATYASGRVFVTAAGASDPTSAVGDIWIELA